MQQNAPEVQSEEKAPEVHLGENAPEVHLGETAATTSGVIREGKGKICRKYVRFPICKINKKLTDLTLLRSEGLPTKEDCEVAALPNRHRQWPTARRQAYSRA